MHSCVTSKNVKWCHLIWPTLYIGVHTWRHTTDTDRQNTAQNYEQSTHIYVHYIT